MFKKMEYVHTVYKERSFTKAAERLGLQFKLIINEQQLI